MAHRCLDGVTGEIANRRAKFFFFFYIMGHWLRRLCFVYRIRLLLLRRIPVYRRPDRPLVLAASWPQPLDGRPEAQRRELPAVSNRLRRPFSSTMTIESIGAIPLGISPGKQTITRPSVTGQVFNFKLIGQPAVVSFWWNERIAIGIGRNHQRRQHNDPERPADPPDGQGNFFVQQFDAAQIPQKFLTPLVATAFAGRNQQRGKHVYLLSLRNCCHFIYFDPGTRTTRWWGEFAGTPEPQIPVRSAGLAGQPRTDQQQKGSGQ